MTTLATLSPIPQYFDLDGDPLDSGFIYFGAPNQNPETNPITVYWDVGAAQPAAQPVRTKNGYIVRAGKPAQLYANGDYSVTVRDKRGRLVLYAQDSADFGNASKILTDIADTTDATTGAGMMGFNYALNYAAGTIGRWLKDLALGTGSAFIGFVQAGVGAVVRTVREKLFDTVSVKDYGAKGDAVADDTAAIQKAINANPNGTVYFPPGAYNITDTLKVEYNNGTGKNSTSLRGQGLGSTLLWNGPDNKSMIWYEATSANAGTFAKTTISGLFLKNQVNANGLIGIRLGNVAGPLGMQGGVANVTIKDNKLDSFDIGISIEYESDGILIQDNVISEYNDYGVYNTGSAAFRVIHNYFQFGNAGSLAVYSEYSTITVSDNLIQSSDANVVGAIQLKNVDGFTITENYIEFANTGSQFAVLLSNSHSGYVGENVIQGMQGADGIYVDGTSGNIDIGPNAFGFFTATLNSLVRSVAGSFNINVLGKQYFSGGPAPAVPLLGAGFNMVIDDGFVMLGQGAYSAAPNAGVSMAKTGVINVGNTAAATGWGFMSFNRSGVNIGGITQSGTTGVAYNVTSDQDLKEDLGVCSSSDVILRTKIHDFAWKGDGAVDRGVFAQEAFQVKPSAVHVGTDERNEEGVKLRPWGVDYSKYVPDLIVTCQQLNAQIQQLQSELSNLSSKGPQ